MNELINLSKESVGIIGGADGPTSVIVSSPTWLIIATAIAVAAVLAAAVGLILFLCRRKH